MKTIHLRGTFPLVFSLVRASEQPSEPIGIYVSSATNELDSDIVLGDAQSPLEFSSDQGNTYGIVTLSQGSVIDGVLFVRAKPTNLAQIPQGTISIGDEVVSYSVDIAAPLSAEANYNKNDLLMSLTSSTYTPSNFTIPAVGAAAIPVNLKNYDLAQVDALNPILISASDGWSVSIDDGATFSNEVVLTSVAVPNLLLGVRVRTTRNKESQKAYPWKVYFTFKNQTSPIIEGCLSLNGSKTLCTLSEGMGKPSSLLGVVNQVCSPTSFRIVHQKRNSTSSVSVTAPSGFLLSTLPNANKSQLSPSLFVNADPSVLSDELLVYVYLDPNVRGDNLSGNIVCRPSGNINSQIEKNIPVSGSNLAASVKAVIKSKNLVTPASPNPINSVELVYENPETGSISILSGYSQNVEYSGSPFFKDDDLTPPVQADPINLETWTSSIPTTPGICAARVSWAEFIDPSLNISFSGGSEIVYYDVLPGSTTSTVYYDVEKYIEIQKINTIPLGYSYSTPAPVLKNINGSLEAQPTIYTKYAGLSFNGDSYESVLAPTYPGNYEFSAFIPDKPSEFYFRDANFNTIPHGFQNNSTILSFSNAGSQVVFDTLNYDPNLIPSRIEVIDSLTFRIRQISDPTKYLTFAGSGNFSITVTQFGQVLTKVCLGLSDSTVASPISGDTKAYTPAFNISKRKVSIVGSPDNVYPSTSINPNTLGLHGLLSGDSITVSVPPQSVGNVSGYYNLDTFEPFSSPNDTYPGLYAGIDQELVYSGSTAVLNKYELPGNFKSESCQIYRKPLYITRPFLDGSSFNASKVYDKTSWFDYSGSLTISGLETGDIVEVEHALSAFDVNPPEGPITTGIDVGPRAAYPEALISGPDALFYHPILSDYVLSFLTITPKLLSALEEAPNLSKVYDGTPKVGGLSIDLNGVLPGDNVFLTSVDLQSKNAGEQTVVLGELGGAHSHNYEVDLTSGWLASGSVLVIPKPITFNLTAIKPYDGLQNYRIPLLSTLVGQEKRLLTEPVCYGPIAPVYSSSSAGSNISSTEAIYFLGGSESNYAVTFVGNYDGSDPNGPKGTITPVSLLLAPNSISGSKMYDGLFDASLGVTFSVLGAVGDDAPQKSDFVFTASVSNPNRGVRACTVNLTGLATDSPYFGNYIVSGTEVGAFTITPKTVNTATASTWLILDGVTGGNTLVFKNENPSVSFAIPENPASTTSFSSVFAFNGVPTPNAKAVGSYEVRLLFPGWSDAGSTSNYRPDPAENSEYVSIPFSVTPRPILVTDISVPARGYASENWPLAALSYQVLNAVPGADPEISVSGTYTSLSGVFVPTSSINITYLVGNPNYSLNPASPSQISAQVTPKTISISNAVDPSTITKTYDGNTQIPQIGWIGVDEESPLGFTGVEVADILAVSIDPASTSSASFLSPNAGTRPILTSFSLIGSKSSNYVLAQPTYHGLINKKTITFSGLHSSSKIFDGSPTASIIFGLSGFSYDGLVESEEEQYGTTPVGRLSAFFVDFNAGQDKEVRLKGLQPPTPNYQFQYLAGSEDELLMPPAQDPYEIFKRQLTIKPKDISKFFGDPVSQEALNLDPTDFIVVGLVVENQNNSIDPVTDKHFGDELLAISRYLTNGWQQNTPTGILTNVTYAFNPVFKPGRGISDNYEILNGQTELTLRGSLIVENAAFKNLTKPIKEAIWAAECTPFGCKDLNWFELVTIPNRFIVAVDFKNTLVPGSNPPEQLADQRIELEQTIAADPEVLVTEG